MLTWKGRSNLPRISTEDTLDAPEDARESRAFFKGRTATAAPFLIARLTMLAAFFRDCVVLEETECNEGEDERIIDEEHENIEIWWLIVNGD